jgi:hypothetical protein
VLHDWYTQNEDHPELNDESTVEYLDGVLTLDCNSHTKSYRVEGPVPTQEDLERVGAGFVDSEDPVNPDDPRDVTDELGLTVLEEVETPAASKLQPPQLW